MTVGHHSAPTARLPRSFFARRVDVVARALLGCSLSVTDAGRHLGGVIVETEAYGGRDDPASHARRGRHGRAAVMFGPPGVAYVFFTYGMHHCFNVVTGREGRASAVLIRAIEPRWGMRAMRRGAPETLADHLVASGPGRLTRALRIDRSDDGTDLVDASRIRLGPGTRSAPIRAGTRVGLSADDGRAWRYWLDSASVSAGGTRTAGTRS